jgi:glycogen(starch) synthase
MSDVLHLSWEYPPWAVGDLSRRLRGILPQLSALLPCALVVRADRDETVQMDGMTVYKVGTSVRASPNFISYSQALNVELTRRGSDALHSDPGIALIHTHDWISSIAGVYLASNFKLPLITSVYSTEETRARPPLNVLNRGIHDLERYCFQKAQALIVETEEMKNHLAEQYKLPLVAEVCVTPEQIHGVYRRWLG